MLEIFERKHSAELAEIISTDEKLNCFLSSQPLDNVSEEDFFVKTSDWIKRKNSKTFAIIEGKKAVGLISLVQDNEDEASIGIWIASPYWHKGIGTKSMLEIFETAKSDGYKICGGRIQKDNIASIKMCVKTRRHF